MDLAIHIITAACMVGAGLALLFLYKLVYQLEVIIERMNRRIDAMKDYEESRKRLNTGAKIMALILVASMVVFYVISAGMFLWN